MFIKWFTATLESNNASFVTSFWHAYTIFGPFLLPPIHPFIFILFPNTIWMKNNKIDKYMENTTKRYVKE